MKKSLLLVLSLTLSILGAFAQQKMKDGTVAQNNLPNKDAILELESTNKGLLFSRISLKSSKDPSPLAAHTAGMMVYNTQSISDVVPGIYYNDGTKWILARQGQASNISYNPTTYTITFTDPSTNLPVVVDLKDVVKKNETLTFLVKQENGTYLYTSENGNKTIINVPADVINNFQAIANDNSVRTILESIFKSTGGNVSYDGTNFTYIDNAGVKQTINISQLVKANETVTTLIDNKNGTYTYTAEDGKQTIINVPANVISNFQTIANDNSVKTIIENIVRNTGGNVFYDGANFTYVDNNGVKQVINISQLVKANETVTTLIDNKNGTYTYTAEDGKQTIINVPANVISNFQSIANDNSVRTIIENIVRNTGGNVFYDGANFTYVDNNGVKQVINISQLVKANETVTTLIDNKNGTYTYTAEDGKQTIINVPADVISNFQNIANDNSVRTIIENIVKNTGGNVFYDGANFTYVDNSGVKQIINISQIVKANETKTTLTYDNTKNELTYTGEDGVAKLIDLNDGALAYDKTTNTLNYTDGKGVVTALPLNTTALVYDKATNALTYTDSKGAQTTIAIKDLVAANETKTILTYDNTKNELTYTGEDGVAKVIDLNDGALAYDKTTNTLNYTDGKGVVTALPLNTTALVYDKANNALTYTDSKGSQTTIAIKDLVAANETKTTLTYDNTKNELTYTGEDGVSKLIDLNDGALAYDKTTNTLNYTDGKGVVTALPLNTTALVYDKATNALTYTDSKGAQTTIAIKDLVAANETKTILTYDNTKNELTYTGEDGVAKVIDLNDGALAYDKTTNTLNYTDGKGVVTALPLNTTALVYDKANNALTYTDSKGVSRTIAIKDLVAANETKTTLTYDNTKNELTYTGEDGVAKVIDLNDGALAYDKTTNTLNYTDGKGVVTALPLNTTALVYDKANNALTYTDSKGVSTTIAIKDLVAANETKTTLTYDNTKNELTYTGEDGVAKLIDLNDGALAYDKTTNTLSYTDGKGVVTALPLNTTALVYDKASNALTYTDSKGVSTTIAIKELVEANQLTSSVVESVTTNVTFAASAANAKNTEYKVEVKDLAITTAKLANNAVTTDKVAEKAITSTKLDAGAGSVGRVGVADANGVVTYQNLSPATLTGKKDITTDGIISVNNANSLTGAVLEATDLKINDNSITTKKINAPAGTNKLVLGYDGAGNVIWSTVDGIAGSTTVSNNITGTALTTTVNGTTGAAVDLKDAIQLGQKTSVVAAGTGTIVTPSTAGNVTTYTVAADLANITLAGDVTGAANATKVEKLQGTPVSATAPAVNQVLTFENGAWVGKKPTVGAADVLNAGNLTSDQITFADGNGATLKNVVATVKAKSITAAMLNSDGATAGQLATADGTGGVTYKTFDATSLANKKAITGDGITVNSPAGDGTDAVLKDVKLGIADNAITTAKIANDAVETSDIKDKNVTAAKLTAGTSTVVNRVATADAAGNVTYTDLTTLVTGAETKLVNGTNTTVTGSGTTADQYKVNVATANGTALGVVKQGNGSVVVAADGGLSVDAAAITTGKALSSTDLLLSANAGTSLLKDVTINIKDKAVTATKLGAATDGTDANKVATADAAGNVTYKAITDASIVSAKKITGSDINVLGGDGATLKDVSLSIKQGTAGQILTTNAAGTATEWVNKADATSVSNTSSGNSLTTTVNGKTGTAVNIINTNALSLDADKKLLSTVNGIATTPALDLTPAITAAQKTASVKNASDKVSVVTTGTGTAGNNTEYSVDVVESKLTLSNLGGKVTNSQITTGAANQVLITKADGTTTQWVDQSTLVPTTTNILSSSANTLTSDVNGVSRTAPIINTNTLTLDGSNKLVSTVNSVATTPALDLTPAIAAAQKTSSVVNGATTTVTSTIAGNNTAYKVEVTDAAIQAGQNTTSLSNGSNTTVTSTTGGKNTNYVVNTNVASTSVTGAVKPGAGLAIDGTGTLTVNASTITTGQDVTTGSDKIKLGGTPVGAALKAFSVDVDETKLNLNANQIKGGTAGQVMVVGAGNVGSWVDKSTLVPTTVVSNTSTGNSLSTTVNGVTGTGVNIINSNALTLDGTNKLVGTVNGQATTALDLTPAIQAAQKTTTVVAGTNVTVSPTTPAATRNTAYTVNVATANGTAPGVVKQGNGSVVVATDGALSVDAAAITTGANVTAASNRVLLGGTPTGAALKAFSVDVVEANLVLQNIGGKVTNNQIATGTTGQVLITNAAGTTQWVDQSTLGDNTTASNGLTKTANNIQLGGALTTPTAIATTGTNTLAISGLPTTGTTADKIVVADPTSGVLKLANAAMPKWFYMPSIVLDVATIGTGKTVNLYNLYKSQFESVPGTMNSTGVQKSIPFLLNPTDLEYYVTYVDAAVITVTSVNANGVMTYNVTGKAKTTSFANIVFVVK
ncbi:beta strand repeat-containing protein [Pedobacter agri]|uniref:beta strand repeat-containing protein n=1 Tax=Pedobacter agri TaxID=454586 RepID=UPI00292F63F5|nr:hypothetical protein [Pedobacter agri]